MKKISIARIVEIANVFYIVASMSYETALQLMDLSSDFTPEQLKQKFKTMAYELHPDRNKSPGAHDKFIQLSAAYDVLKNPKTEFNSEEPISEPGAVNPFDLSYEDISNMRNEMGRDKFNEEFPGWETELKREMGLDQWNSTFEGYDPNYEPPSRDGLLEALRDHADDQAYDIYSELEENNKLGHYFDSESDLVDKYFDPSQDPWLMRIAKQKPHSEIIERYKKLLTNALRDVKERHIDDFDLSIEDVLSYPEYKVIRSFLIKNIDKVEIPDELLSNKEFGHVVGVLLGHDPEHLETGLKILQQYGHNKRFLDSFFNSSGIAYIRRLTSPEVKEVIKNLPFDPKQKETISKLIK